ncbi:MAG TPA: aldo/keto reductase [Bryobacteraceae bacterium]|nr:aldo/keto reductase [Bryobacteraceae bacterium]
MSTSRREFFQSTAALAGIAKSLSGADAKLPTRPLGKTGERVSILAFGGGQRFYTTRNEEDAVRFVAQAVEAGITYFDTADSYQRGRSEQLLARGFRARGGKRGLFLATKISSRDGAAVQATVEQSLRNLEVDQVDLIQIHSLESEDDLARIEAKGGVLEALLKAREQKLTRFIGISSHDAPAAMKLALERHDFDCCQMALNAAMADMIGTTRPVTAGDQSFEALALPVARRKNMGVIAMKVFARDALSGQPEATARNLIYYALSLPVSTAVVGLPTVGHLEENVRLAMAFQPLAKAEMERLARALSTRNKAALVEFFRHHVDA